ncbi:MAG: hypothetical protein K2X93_06715 [Candidatus Obscuribacterales bacterium]|nr:hypothetical protein [Candidatus Obscuribacterales bacterium]
MFKNIKIKSSLAVLMLVFSLVFAPAAWAVRTSLTVQDVPKWRDGLGASEDVCTFTAADASNGNSFDFTPGIIIITRNVHGSTSYTYTVASKADSLGRSGDLGPQTLTAGQVRILQLDGVEGFRQDDGKVYINGNNASIEFAVVRPR